MCASDSDVSARLACQELAGQRQNYFIAIPQEIQSSSQTWAITGILCVVLQASMWTLARHTHTTCPTLRPALRSHASCVYMCPFFPTCLQEVKQYIQRPYFRPSVLPSVLPSCALASLADRQFPRASSTHYRKLHSQLLSLARLSGPHWTRNSITRCREKCQIECQLKCHNKCQVDCPTTCQVECQNICQNVCQIKCPYLSI